MSVLLPEHSNTEPAPVVSDATLLPIESQDQLLPVIAIREGVVFPNTESVLTFGRRKSVLAINESLKSDKRVVLVSQKQDSIAEPTGSELFEIGTLAVVERTLKTNDEVNALVRGISRVKILKIDEQSLFLRATIQELFEVSEITPEVEALTKHLTNQFKTAVNHGKSVEFLNFMKLMSGVSPAELADQIASTLEISTVKKQAMLEQLDVKLRLEMVSQALDREVKVLEIERNIANKTQKKFDKHMRETVLRERLKTIQRELGEGEDEEERELEELRLSVDAAGMPKKVKEKAYKELRRLSQMSINNPEAGYIRTWLETMIELPWKKRSRGVVSMTKAAKVLDEDHYGLQEVKERILEFLAVLKLRAKQSEKQAKRMPTIISFVGAPGVGKTSIGKSIARALGREFVKVSLGGVHDEAEIRGHRRTYVGSMPGRIIQAMKTAGTTNPVFMLDEIDKITNTYHGDPSAALLEALDPEQNHAFVDHYLEVPYDLSDVMFIATANVLDSIPHALRDRLEVIKYSGYTEEEKFQIAKKYLLKKVMEANGVKQTQLSLPDNVVKDIIRLYTREAGVRSLEREIGKVVRKAARMLAEGKETKVLVTTERLEDLLGPAKYLPVLAEAQDEVGLATGLAWTSVGGEVMFIEVSIMPGRGSVTLTGQLGKVMQESARAALTFVRSNAEALGLKKDNLSKMDVHVHVPEGAVPKDGPSAGITMTTAIVSALTGRKVRRHVAMTGEVTLRGRVLEIGGLKEKVIAAHRAGITEVIIPFANGKDVREIPEAVRGEIKFHPVKTIEEVLRIALEESAEKLVDDHLKNRRPRKVASVIQ